MKEEPRGAGARRTRTALLAAALLAGPALGSEPSGAASVRRPLAPEDLYCIRSATEAQVSPDGTRVALVERQAHRDQNRTRSQVWLLTLADGSLRRLSDPGADDVSPRWSPDGRQVAYLSVSGGKRNVVVAQAGDLTRREVAGYETTNEPLAFGATSEHLAWSPDGASIAYLSADAGPEPPPGDPIVITRYSYKSWAGMADNRRWHVHLVVAATGEVRRLTDGPYQDHSLAFSPTGEEIAFISNREPEPDRIHNYDLFAVRVRDGRVRRITQTPGSEYLPAWSPDGKQIAYLAGVRALSTRESSAEDTHVFVVDAAGGPGRKVAPGLDRRATLVQWAPAGEPAVFFTAHDRGNVPLYRATVDGKVDTVVGGPGRVGAFSVAKTGTIAFTFLSPGGPAEVHLRSAEGAVRPATRLNADWLAEREVSIPEPFDFESSDGKRIHGFLFPPLGQKPGRRYPMVAQVHGGPHDQQGPVFAHRPQVLAGRGYAVAHINYRGSTGYGQEFAEGTVGDQNGKEARDVLEGVEHLMRRMAYLDPTRVGLEGNSYGGQLTNWLITQTERFRAAISLYGISNLVSFAYTVWAPDYVQVEFGGYPWERDIAARMWERSALAHVARVKTPTMFIHGELDQDVHIVEAEQMYMALKEVGVESTLVRYPREQHGLRETRHVIDALDRSLAWYDRFLGPAGSAAESAR